MSDIRTIVADHIVPLQETLTKDLLGKETAALPFAAYFQPGFPYWTNQVALQSVERPSGDIRIYVYRITMRLFLGKLTEGYEGDIETDCIDLLHESTAYFEARPRLTLPNGTSARYLHSRGCTVANGEVAIFGNPPTEGGGDQKFGVNVRLDVPVQKPNVVIG